MEEAEAKEHLLELLRLQRTRAGQRISKRHFTNITPHFD